MKKHVFGFAVFALIVTAALVADDFLTPAEICPNAPSVSRFDIPDQDPELNPANFRDLTVKTTTAVYFVDRNNLNSQATLVWSGAGEPPKMLFVEPRLYTTSRLETSVALPGKLITDPFANGNTANVKFDTSTVIGRVKKENMYLSFSVKDKISNRVLTNPAANATGATQVIVSSER